LLARLGNPEARLDAVRMTRGAIGSTAELVNDEGRC